MTGVDIIGALLRASPTVTAMVPPAQIKAGRLGENEPLPALLVRSVSTVERLKLKRVGLVRCVERIAVTVRAKSYREQVAIMKLLPPACAGKIGTIADATSVSVFNAGTGPDLDGPGNTYEQTQDFRASFDTPA